MYNPQLLLQTIDANKAQVVAMFSVVLVLQYVFLIEAIRITRRDMAYAIPLFCTYYWFAHDFGGVIRFNDWFAVYDHWYTKGYWFGLLLSNLMELVFLWQFIKYGRKELMPHWSQAAFTVLVLVGLLFAEVTFEFFKSAFTTDPLFQMDGMITQIVFPAFGAALLMRRQSTRGQSILMWGAFTAMTALYSITTYLWYGEAFQSWQCIAAGIFSTLGGAAMVCVIAMPAERLFGRVPYTALSPSSTTT